MSEHSLELWDACASGNLDLAKFLLNSNLSLDMNWRGLEKGDTPLHRACRFGHLHLVEILLKLSTVDVNAENAGLATPFLIACQNGHTEVVLLLMADMRVDLNKPAKDLTTPLWFASQNGRLDIVQFMLASDREVHTKTKCAAGPAAWNDKTTAEIGRLQATRNIVSYESEEDYKLSQQNGPLIADLIDAFNLDPVLTRQQLRELPELRDFFISDLFAQVIFLCEDLLTVRAESSASSSANNNNKAARFFQIARCLPIELQMMLCNRVFGAGKDMVLTKHSEPAFKKLGLALTRS